MIEVWCLLKYLENNDFELDEKFMIFSMTW
ncbi:hypothetical protein Xvie_01134 [Xenorhabdus vietnamensis]|uniref:Uncharacterized protein n=1 Tax=Xenorhabdus vietnamensis TaxID=351656 RepID=A0A1Y2SI71_9GAMM|nr:hypothetical protein Xvie_01134 [Xenorhabdus vietnamensis]